MTIVGKVESLWRYPVKSMAGETVDEVFVGYAGVFGDRLYAFLNQRAPAGFPYLTGRTRPEMLRYRASFRDSANTLRPPNQADAEGLGPGLTPVYPQAADLVVDVTLPSGERFTATDPRIDHAPRRQGRGCLRPHVDPLRPRADRLPPGVADFASHDQADRRRNRPRARQAPVSRQHLCRARLRQGALVKTRSLAGVCRSGRVA